jgi:hypothetical protein
VYSVRQPYQGENIIEYFAEVNGITKEEAERIEQHVNRGSRYSLELVLELMQEHLDENKNAVN